MSRSFNGTSAYEHNNSVAFTGLPMTMFSWFKIDPAVATDFDMAAMGWSKTSVIESVLASVVSNSVSNVAEVSAVLKANTGEWSWQANTTSPGKNVWANSAIRFDAADSRSSFVNGGSKFTDTSWASSPTGMDHFTVGALQWPTNSFFFKGLIAHSAVWDVALTDAEIALLGAGAAPSSIQPGHLLGYWPGQLINVSGTNYVEDVSGNAKHLSIVNSTASSDNPAVGGPAQITFADQIGVPISSTRTSNIQTITGISAPKTFTVTGGVALINGGAGVTAGSVSNNDEVQLRHTSAATYSTPKSTTFVCGAMTAAFLSETMATPPALVINGDNIVVEGESLAFESSAFAVTGASAIYLRHNTRKVAQLSLVVVDADSATANYRLAVSNIGVPFTSSRHTIYGGITVASVDHEVVIDHLPVSGDAYTVNPASMASTDGSLFKNLLAFFTSLGLATSINDQCVAPDVIGGTPTTWLLDGSGNLVGYVDAGPTTGSATARYFLAANESWYDINFTLLDGQIDTVAPSFVAGPNITNITQTTADFTGTPNDSGFYGLALLPAAAAVPAADVILAGTVSGAVFSRSETAMLANTAFTAALTAMTAGNAWRLHIALRDTAAAPNKRVVSSSIFNTLTADSTAPNFSAGPAISNVLLTTASLTATPNESGVYGLCVLPSAASAPLAPAILAASVAGSLWNRASTAMTAGVQISAALAGLAQGQSYRVHAALQDATGNNRVVTSASFTMQASGDIVAPNFTAGPGIANLQTGSLDVTFTPDEAGQYRIVMVSNLAPPPVVDDVLNGTGSGGSAAASASALLSMSAAAVVITPLIGLAPGQTYTPYVALRDAAGNKRLANAGPVTMLTVADDVDPSINITVSTAGAVHTITASPSDNVGVVGVSFMLNGAPLGPELISPPWQKEWNSTGFPAGNYSLSALARDASNNTTLSNSVLVQVADSGEPTGAPVSRGGRGIYEQRGAAWYRVEEETN